MENIIFIAKLFYSIKVFDSDFIFWFLTIFSREQYMKNESFATKTQIVLLIFFTVS